MHTRQPVPSEVLRLAEIQSGAVSRQQCIGLGMTRHLIDRRLRTGEWLRLAPGVYCPQPVPPGWRGSVWAAILVAGEGSRVAGLAAARLHSLISEDPDLVTVLVPAERWAPTVQPTGVMRWQFVREVDGMRDRRSPGNPPRLTVEDTVLDLAASGTPEEVTGWLTTAVQSRRTTARRLERALAARPSIRYRRLMHRLLGEVAEGAESPLELSYLRGVEQAHRLPRARRQVRRGATVADVLYEKFGVIVELDGRLGHEGAGRFRDMSRDNAATARGLLTLRYGWADAIGNPCAVARQVAEVLVSRGWSGELQPCSRCRRAGSDRDYAA